MICPEPTALSKHIFIEMTHSQGQAHRKQGLRQQGGLSPPIILKAMVLRHKHRLNFIFPFFFNNALPQSAAASYDHQCITLKIKNTFKL